MANPTYPGVYVEEVASGVRPIEAVGTSTAAFVGLAERGPDDEALKISSWTEYQRYFGSFIRDGHLAESVFQFFNNGGQQCYVVRVTRSGDDPAKTATAKLKNAAGETGIEFAAKSKGEWGNDLTVTTDPATADPFNEFKIAVGRASSPNGALPLEIHDNLSMDPSAPNFVSDALRSRSTLIDVTALDTKSLQRGRHRGGDDPALPLREKRSFVIDIDHDGPQQVELPDSVKETTELKDVAGAITDAVRGLTKKRRSTPAEAFTKFECTVEDNPHPHLLLQSGQAEHPSSQSSVVIQRASGDRNATGLLKLGAADGGVSQDALAVRLPRNGGPIQLGDNVVADPVADVQTGTDGSGNVSPNDFEAAFHRLDSMTDFSLLAVPGENSTALVDKGLSYCANRPLKDVFYIAEMTQTDDTVPEAKTFRDSLPNPNSYGALYFPWIKALDPSGASTEPVLLPPSGYIAGLYARTDANRGVWKAPAGTSASLAGAVGLATELTDLEHGDLNPKDVNVIRRFTTAGLVAFGARTIHSEADWKYVPVRRTAIMLRVSIYYGIQWAVFEPNDELLWSQLRLNITSFMMTLFRRGAFQGATPSDAFFVKCDGETTTQADIDLGIVNVTVGFAPLKPAEFVIVKISQSAGQAA